MTTHLSHVCTIAAHHQRGAAVLSALASDLGLPAGHWPATLLCHLPDGQRAVFHHAWCDRGEHVHCYTSVRPAVGLTLIVHNPLHGIALEAMKESV